MRLSARRHAPWMAVLAGAGVLALTAAGARGQAHSYVSPGGSPPPCSGWAPAVAARPGAPAYSSGATPATAYGAAPATAYGAAPTTVPGAAPLGAAPTTPQTPQAPQAPQAPERPTPERPSQQPSPDLSQPPSDVGLADQRFAGLGGEAVALGQSAVGYIDPAMPFTNIRLRFDAAYDNNRPDRAEFFYAKCGCLRDPRLLLDPRTAGLFDPNAAGPPLVETSVDYQDIATHLEYAFGDRFSAFVEVPVRFLNPEQNDNTAGLADINAGFKYALVACRDRYVTFQFRTYFPTGDSDRGLGTDHVSLEPGLLFYQKLSDQLFLEAELKDWIPIDGSDFAGNVVRYGVGLRYNVIDRKGLIVAPITEVVGWTVLDGKEAVFGVPQDASGDTIVNIKTGVRVWFGEGSSVYAGYGRPLTGDVWYEDILRLEYRLAF